MEEQLPELPLPWLLDARSYRSFGLATSVAQNVGDV